MRLAAASIVAVLAIASPAAQSDSFKLGRFAQGGRTFLGVVVDDKTVAEIPSSVGSSLKAVIADYPKHRAALRDLAVRARGERAPAFTRWRLSTRWRQSPIHCRC